MSYRILVEAHKAVPSELVLRGVGPAYKVQNTFSPRQALEHRRNYWTTSLLMPLNAKFRPQTSSRMTRPGVLVI